MWDLYQDMFTDVQNGLSCKKQTKISRSVLILCKFIADATGHNKFVTWDVLVKTARPGDLIEFCRGAYNHWAMMSEYPGKVYNICAESKNETSAEIKLEKLRDVCERGPSPDRRRARVNNKNGFRGLLPMAFTGSLKPLSPNESIELAKEMEGSFVPYNFTGKNCEYYCTLWKFGKRFTDQVIDLVNLRLQTEEVDTISSIL